MYLKTTLKYKTQVSKTYQDYGHKYVFDKTKIHKDEHQTL